LGLYANEIARLPQLGRAGEQMLPAGQELRLLALQSVKQSGVTTRWLDIRAK